jgi:hypothetical protein
MTPIRSMTEFYRLMHRKLRQKRGVLLVRGAEVIRALPSEVAKPKLSPGPKSIEDQEHSAQAATPNSD